LYDEQNIKFTNTNVSKDVLFFLKERFKNLLKDKKIRNDIIESVDLLYGRNDFLTIYNKCLAMNKNISKDICKNIISSYKRVFNIIDQEIKSRKIEISGHPEASLFRKDEEKNLYDKINEIREYFAATRKKENHEETLRVLVGAKLITDNFFENIIVNDENSDIKKNRLELLQMFCNTYNNFVDFSKVEGV